MKKVLVSLVPWLITIAAVVYVCNGLDWQVFLNHARNGRVDCLLLAIFLTAISYFFRSYRWLYFFPDRKALSYVNALKVLILGFFMNNVLPARTGELVRAHMGARVSGLKRTLVLATVASERLIDGLTISVLFLVFAYGLRQSSISSKLTIVAFFFACATAGVLIVLIFRARLFTLFDRIASRLNHRYSDYALNRFQIFIEGLSPLANLQRLPAITVLSLIIWAIELSVYAGISTAFGAGFALPELVLFMVTVNFSSLIPAAPGAIGVIEAVTTTVLVSLGVEKELALSMVVSQHLIQYLVVGLPGICILSTWRKQVKNIEQDLQDA